MTIAVEFASLTVRAPNGMDLEQYLNGIIAPAFFESETWSHGKSKFAYSLSNVVLHRGVVDGNNLYFISGRFVRSETIRREKRLVDDKLVNSKGQFDYATTSIFTLCLNNHRLGYAQETEKNPKIDEFYRYISKMIRIKWYAYQDSEYYKRAQEKLDGDREKKTTRAELREEYPLPDISLIPIASEDSLEEYIDRFEIIQTATIEYILPNQDWDDDDLDAAIREKAEAAKSVKTSLSFHNRNGLEEDVVKSQMSTATEGNTNIKIIGKNKDGSKISGNNEDFKFTTTIPEINPSVQITALAIYNKLLDLVQDNVLRVKDAVRNSSFLDNWFTRGGRNINRKEELVKNEGNSGGGQDDKPGQEPA